MVERAPKLAVLIDADNTSAAIADGLMVEVAKLGEASLRRAYGDYSGTGASGWNKDVLGRHAIQAHHQYPYTRQKNATDIAMVIDAMDLLHSGRFDGFCLVSSDSDFTPLAARIRAEGVDVYGIGRTTSPESFRQACSRFIFTENLRTAGDGEAAMPPRGKPEDAAPLLTQAIAEMEEDSEGWYHLGQVGQILNNLSPEFDARSYGFAKLSDLVNAIGTFEIRRGTDYVRMRPVQTPKPEARTPAKPKSRTRRKANPKKTAD